MLRNNKNMFSCDFKKESVLNIRNELNSIVFMVGDL